MGTERQRIKEEEFGIEMKKKGDVHLEQEGGFKKKRGGGRECSLIQQTNFDLIKVTTLNLPYRSRTF